MLVNAMAFMPTIALSNMSLIPVLPGQGLTQDRFRPFAFLVRWGFIVAMGSVCCIWN